MNEIMFSKDPHCGSPCFLVRVRVRRRANLAEKHTVKCAVYGADSSTQAVDLFCAHNTFYVVHSPDYVLDDFSVEEIK